MTPDTITQTVLFPDQLSWVMSGHVAFSPRRKCLTRVWCAAQRGRLDAGAVAASGGPCSMRGGLASGELRRPELPVDEREESTRWSRRWRGRWPPAPRGNARRVARRQLAALGVSPK